MKEYITSKAIIFVTFEGKESSVPVVNCLLLLALHTYNFEFILLNTDCNTIDSSLNSSGITETASVILLLLFFFLDAQRLYSSL